MSTKQPRGEAGAGGHGHRRPRVPPAVLLSLLALLLTGCAARHVGERAYRFQGDEIMVAGQLFHTGAPVVLWLHPGGYDGYRVERRFTDFDEANWEASEDVLETPNRYGLRHRGDWPAAILDDLRGGGWDLPLLQRVVDQIVIHYDASGSSRQCFETLHDHRGLSAHFLIDLDGTIYQTLDVKERAWHAGVANDRSIGIEIANVGAYPSDADAPFDGWYIRADDGRTILTPPDKARLPKFRGGPARDEPVVGEINGQTLIQYDLTPRQYRSLTRLTAALCRVFPRIEPDAPRDARGEIRRDAPLTEAQLAAFQGILGHHHISANKVDPGPAFQWDRFLRDVRGVLRSHR